MPKLGEATETTSELIADQTQDQLDDEKAVKENSKIALTTMLMALLAAFGALMAGISAQDALITRTAEIIDVSVQESDRLAMDILKAKHEILISMGEKPDEAEAEQIAKYDREATERAQKATSEEEIVEALALPHLVFAVAVTLLSVGIALNGIAVVVDRKLLWLIGVTFGLLGTTGIVMGTFMMTAL